MIFLFPQYEFVKNETQHETWQNQRYPIRLVLGRQTPPRQPNQTSLYRHPLLQSISLCLPRPRLSQSQPSLIPKDQGISMPRTRLLLRRSPQDWTLRLFLVQWRQPYRCAVSSSSRICSEGGSSNSSGFICKLQQYRLGYPLPFSFLFLLSRCLRLWLRAWLRLWLRLWLWLPVEYHPVVFFQFLFVLFVNHFSQLLPSTTRQSHGQVSMQHLLVAIVVFFSNSAADALQSSNDGHPTWTSPSPSSSPFEDSSVPWQTQRGRFGHHVGIYWL